MKRPLSVGLAFAAVLALAPWVWDTSLALSVLSQVGIAIVVCLSYNVLLGQGGMLSFGHAVFMGAGAFAAMHALRAVGPGTAWLPVSLLPLLGGLAAALLAAGIGAAITRRSGATFAMITLAIGELAWAAATMLPGWFGGEAGLTANRVAGPAVAGLTWGPARQMYALVAVHCWLCTMAMYGLTRTPLGRLLNAVRDNPERVGFIGYSAWQVRWLGLVASAFFAGIAGGLGALLFEIVSTEVFSATRSGTILLFTYLGGAGWFAGPVVGAVLMVVATVLLSQWTPAWQLYVGGAFLLAVMHAPQGLAGLAVTHGRALWQRPSLCLAYGLWAAGAAVTLAGVVLGVELLYRWRLDTLATGPLRLGGVALDSSATVPWLGAVAAMAGGGAVVAQASRRLRRHHPDAREALA